jgi:hypothetical protein
MIEKSLHNSDEACLLMESVEEKYHHLFTPLTCIGWQHI